MAKIIFTSRYIKGNAEAIINFVNYIATRDNAEHFVFANDKKVTEKQKAWIAERLAETPELTELFEYEDYMDNPSMTNASRLISRIAESKMEFGGVENYVDYLAKRPRSEKLEQGHALFSGEDKRIDLNKVKKEASEHKGYIWTHVVSLRREDAQKLGYDHAMAWRELVRSKIPEIAENMKIPIENLVWYGAYHDEGHHPHIHLMVYSENSREGYLTEKGIKNMRRTFAKEIFHDEQYHAYVEKDITKKEIQKYFSSEIQKASQLENQSNPKAESLLLQLAKNMKVSKYKVYGRLDQTNKNLVDRIVAEICKDEKVQRLYEGWLGAKDARSSVYHNTSVTHKTLDQRTEFRDIKNMVVKAAKEIDFSDEAMVLAETSEELNLFDINSFDNQVLPLAESEMLTHDANIEELDVAATNEVSVPVPEDWAVDIFEGNNSEKNNSGKSNFKENNVKKSDSNKNHVPADEAEFYQCELLTEEDADACIRYKQGKINLRKDGMLCDYEKGIGYMKEAAANKNMLALFVLLKESTKKEEPLEVTKEQLDEWLEQLLTQAEKGDAFSQYVLGYYYFFNSNRDVEQAKLWLQKAEENGNEFAQNLISFIEKWEEGQGMWYRNQAKKSFMNLLKRLGGVIEDDYRNRTNATMRIESKLSRKLREKKLAQGQKLE